VEQRIYRGNVNPNGLADFLVGTFNHGYGTVAQKVGQGDQVLVQIGHMSHRGLRGIRSTIGVSIVRTPEGMNVGVGQSNWLDLDDPRLGGMLIGAVFFPPLLIFPLLRGIRSFALYEQIWDAVDSYGAQVGARQAEVSVAHGVTCPRCGVLNHEEARFCTTCGAPLQVAGESQPSASAAPEVICPECRQTVRAGKFCSNCGTRLSG
jgi:DNA-directed RNA polymerase subunit RPC12/RpoP